MTGLPRKYAKMGFKAGWRAYRAQGHGHKTEVKHMARRRGRIRTAFHKFRRSRAGSRAGKFMGILAPVAYGAVRQKMSTALAPYTAKIPLGNLADNAGMLAALWATDRFIGNKVPMIRPIAKAGMQIELALIGGAIASGQVNLNSIGGGSSGSAVIG